MAAGRGAERSVWAQALHEEAASADGRATAAVYLDLVKAFDKAIRELVFGFLHGVRFHERVPYLISSGVPERDAAWLVHFVDSNGSAFQN